MGRTVASIARPVGPMAVFKRLCNEFLDGQGITPLRNRKAQVTVNQKDRMLDPHHISLQNRPIPHFVPVEQPNIREARLSRRMRDDGISLDDGISRGRGSVEMTGFRPEEPPSGKKKASAPRLKALAWLSCGGDEGDRTLDLLDATEALSQLSYVPRTSEHFSNRPCDVNENYRHLSRSPIHSSGRPGTQRRTHKRHGKPPPASRK